MDTHDPMPVQTETVSSYYDQQGNIVKKVTTTVENYEIGAVKIRLDPQEPSDLESQKTKAKTKANAKAKTKAKTKAPVMAADVCTTMVPSSTTLVVLRFLVERIDSPVGISFLLGIPAGSLHLCLVVAIILRDGPPHAEEGRGLAHRRPRASPAMVHPRTALRPVRLEGEHRHKAHWGTTICENTHFSLDA